MIFSTILLKLEVKEMVYSYWISGNSPSSNMKLFASSASGIFIHFLNCLKSLLDKLEGPLVMLIFSVSIFFNFTFSCGLNEKRMIQRIIMVWYFLLLEQFHFQFFSFFGISQNWFMVFAIIGLFQKKSKQWGWGLRK